MELSTGNPKIMNGKTKNKFNNRIVMNNFLEKCLANIEVHTTMNSELGDYDSMKIIYTLTVLEMKRGDMSTGH